jgi:acetyl-CoA C-acetyltransferase
VFNACEGLGIEADDPRPLTVTGGLPFFGGAGNNYSMHAIASMVRALRERPDARGLVAANGGYLSKYSVGVYGAEPRPWRAVAGPELQIEIDAWPVPPTARGEGAARVDTYTVDFSGPVPVGIVIVRLESGGARAIARTDLEEAAVAKAMTAAEPLGGRVVLALDVEGRSIVREFQPAESRQP